jgi:hypothetical protein
MPAFVRLNSQLTDGNFISVSSHQPWDELTKINVPDRSVQIYFGFLSGLSVDSKCPMRLN